MIAVLYVFGRQEDRRAFFRGLMPSGATEVRQATYAIELSGGHRILTAVVGSCEDAKTLIGLEPDLIILHDSYRRCEKCQAIFESMLRT